MRELPVSARFVFTAGAILLASCASSADPGSPTPAGPSPTLQSASPADSPAARTCISSSDGPEVLCSLEAATYSTEYLEPGLTYTVPAAGWGSLDREVSPGNFHLFPPGGSLAGMNLGTSDDITLLSAAVPPGTCNGQPSTEFEPTFHGLVEFLTNNDHVVLSNVRDASVGGWDGTVMDIAYVRADGCPDGDYADLMVGVDPSHGAFGITPAMAGVRLYLLQNPRSATPLAILIDDAAGGGSDYGDGADWYGAAKSVIDTFVFVP
jgi:hypothetical protein